MSAALVTFANIGRKPNLRTTDMLPILDAFAARGEPLELICQIAEGSPYPRSYPAVPTPLRYALRLAEKLSGRTLSRRASERLFDIFASRRLTKADVAFLHGSYFLPRTAARVHRLGGVTVEISVSAEMGANARLEREELARLGFPEYRGWYTALAEEVRAQPPCDYLILMSEFTKRTYLEAGYPADRIFIAHLDVDTERFSPPTHPDPTAPFRVLYLAYTQPLKGLHYLLDAWESLALPGAELVIAGGFADMPAELEAAYRERMGKDPSIRFVGGVSKPEELYRDASVFVFPSLSEGFGRSALEAMACGIPVITTEHAASIVEDGATGFVVPIRDPGAIADKVRTLYADRALAGRMGAAARRAALEKSSFGEEVFGIYQTILAREGKLGA
ncbi:MAG: glycosyltransferase family 4 protein [Patescibacteria group bacterium]|nr:glycosyltransferase family 4 protein [Patescibacteria group bacterium]MDE1943985.1 glycosyltransferase family 4 protein [Patescibacteria group bacterium]MDE1945408.1 glycosyltransferase family 4 protein [Patescibacteria group bacterium]MDE2057699.1 glycosyltransferase family 4 protein [Patescibacteria group bacterium]